MDWLTPAEVFRPWFGRSIAKFILEERRHAWESAEPLLIVEVGGGTGTLAASMLVGGALGGGALVGAVAAAAGGAVGGVARGCGWERDGPTPATPAARVHRPAAGHGRALGAKNLGVLFKPGPNPGPNPARTI